MAKQSHTPSRRAMLAGLAAAPVAGLPAIAGVIAEPDPVSAAFDGLANALAAYKRVEDDCADNVLDEVCGAVCDAEVNLYSTAPTTPAGAMRLLMAVADYLSEEGNLYDTYLETVLGDAVRNAAAVLARGAQS